MTVKALRTADDLVNAGHVKASDRQAIENVIAHYSMTIPAYVSGQIEGRAASDPVARQYVPDTRELTILPGERADPIGDHNHAPVTGIVHRYKDRVLLKVVHICPVYCRFCFRREMVGPGHEPNLSPAQLSAALAYVAARSEISEVILTGGDPFVLATHRIGELTSAISRIPHIQRIRWHTRVPVVEPAKVTPQLAQALKSNTAQTIVAIHANHPQEFTTEAAAAIAELHGAGHTLLSQSVLLKGINDDVATLTNLIEAFASHQVKPYYLHHADLAPGTSHFRTTIRNGINLMRSVIANRAAPPAYVLDIPGGYSKVNLLSENAIEVSPNHWRLKDANGKWHDYFEDPSLCD